MKITIQESFEKFIVSRELADLSEKSIKNYSDFISPFICSVGADKSLDALTEDDVNDYIAKVVRRHITRATKSTYIRHLKIYLRWLENTYYFDFNAKNIKVPKTPKRNVRIYSTVEIEKIFNAVQNEVEWIELRNKSIIALMYDSGLRQAEVCTLKMRNISLDENRLVVRGKGNKERTVPLGQFAKRILCEYLKMCPYSSAYVFVGRYGEAMSCNSVKLMMSKVARRLDFEFSSHKLRHNFATNYCLDQYEKNNHIDIYRLMVLMGHEDIETTRRYLHMANEIIASKESVSHLDKVKCI